MVTNTDEIYRSSLIISHSSKAPLNPPEISKRVPEGPSLFRKLGKQVKNLRILLSAELCRLLNYFLEKRRNIGASFEKINIENSFFVIHLCGKFIFC